MSHSRNVSFTKPQEPSFLKAFKAKVGYKEPEVTVDSKREVPKKDDGREKERYIKDELPTVVLEDDGGVTEEEYKEYVKQQEQIQSEEHHEASAKSLLPDSQSLKGHQSQPDEQSTKDKDVRIVFKKPRKRSSSEASGEGEGEKESVMGGLYSSSKRTPTGSERKESGKRVNNKSGRRGVKNSSLLSFGEEEDT